MVIITVNRFVRLFLKLMCLTCRLQGANTLMEDGRVLSYL